MSRRMHVSFYNTHAAYISGHGTRELIAELRGRPPVWATRQRAWVVSERTAKDVLAMAEARGWDASVSHTKPSQTVAATTVCESPEPERSLW